MRINDPYFDNFDLDNHAIGEALDCFKERIKAIRGPAYLFVGRLSDQECFTALVTPGGLKRAARGQMLAHLKRLLRMRRGYLRRQGIAERTSVTVIYAEAARLGLAVLEKQALSTTAAGSES